MVRLVIPLVAALPIGSCSQSEPTDQSVTPTTAGAATEEGQMRITSPQFADGETIPTRYTCDGEDVSPPLVITDVPPGTVSLALIMDDPDAPVGTWDHWVVFDIPPTGEIPEDVGQLGTPGTNSWGRTGYGGPCPPSGVHRYIFKLFALDASLGLPEGADKAEVMAAVQEHALAEATMIGRYRR